MTRIVTSTYRYKRPPRKRAKAAAIEAPAIVDAKSSRRSRREKQAAAEKGEQTASPRERGRTEPSKLAIVTVKRKSGRFADVPDVTPEEHQRHGDAADALWRELVRRAIGKE